LPVTVNPTHAPAESVHYPRLSNATWQGVAWASSPCSLPGTGHAPGRSAVADKMPVPRIGLHFLHTSAHEVYSMSWTSRCNSSQLLRNGHFEVAPEKGNFMECGGHNLRSFSGEGLPPLFYAPMKAVARFQRSRAETDDHRTPYSADNS